MVCEHKELTKEAIAPAPLLTPMLSCPLTSGLSVQVARDEGLYEYTADTRAGCTVFEGSKQLLLTLGRFVVVVSWGLCQRG